MSKSKVAVVLAAASFAATVSWACGDKMMLLAKGARFGQINPARSASILAYVRSNSAVPAVVKDLQLQPGLRKAGHKVEAFDDLAKFDEALKGGNYDVVLADVSDAEGLEQHMRGAPSGPVLLPVVFKSTKAEQNAAQTKFHCVLKSPGTADNYLAAIDQAMDWKSKSARKVLR